MTARQRRLLMLAAAASAAYTHWQLHKLRTAAERLLPGPEPGYGSTAVRDALDRLPAGRKLAERVLEDLGLLTRD